MAAVRIERDAAQREAEALRAERDAAQREAAAARAERDAAQRKAAAACALQQGVQRHDGLPPPLLLARIVSWLPEDDWLAAALTRTKLRAVVAQRVLSTGAVQAHMQTSALPAFASESWLAWSHSCGVPLTKSLCRHAASLGQLRTLS